MTEQGAAALSFPNPSRSFEAGKNRVCFWGYDRAMEITFYVATDVLRKLDPEINGTERAVLKAFDAALELVHHAAAKAYGLGRKRAYAYSLRAEDF